MKKFLALSVLSLAASTAFADPTLTGTVRDFTPGPLVPGSTNPDFESGIGGLVTGLVSFDADGHRPDADPVRRPGIHHVDGLLCRVVRVRRRRACRTRSR